MANPHLRAWVSEVAAHAKPDAVEWCDGSALEGRMLEDRMVTTGTLIPLSSPPRSFLHRSNPADVARTEQSTFICSTNEIDAGPTNNWMSPDEARRRVWSLFDGAMRGRTMYVVPYLMGPVDSPYSRVGVELTDSPYVAASLRIMTRVGESALRALGDTTSFVRGVHSLGDLSPERKYICHFPEARTIWSIGSGYGGNALLSKKCHALRIASVEARDEGWLAEHMMIIGITNPKGVTHYVAAAFPSACGKTNLAMLSPSRPGWKIETVGDDICWMHVGSDGRLWAVNPEAGFFGVAPGTSDKTNPAAMAMLEHDVVFTNVALRKDGTPWWEGRSELAEDEALTDWRGREWRRASEEPAAHPNARFTVAATQCPTVGARFDDPRGVPISAIVFGGRRATLAPLVYEARDWAHGVYVGATLVSETTAAATGAVGVARNDPMAMLPFCGYNMGDYFGHWLEIGERLSSPPHVFHVNWFRRAEDGRFLWPGFRENIRVLEWIVGRVEARASARPTPLGLVPMPEGFDLQSLALSRSDVERLFAVDPQGWKLETTRSESFLTKFGSRLPKELLREHDAFSARLQRSTS